MALETVALLTPSSYRVWLRKGKENVRIAKIFDSPYHPEREVTFRITEEGVVD
jgi:DNA repair protein RadA